MHKLNPRTAALLSAFGWAVGSLLAGKALAVLLPMPPGGAVRCSAGRSRWAGDRLFFCRRRCSPCSTAALPP